MNRNQLCACGSGKRYKHCHGAAVAASAATAPASAAPGVNRQDPLTTLHLALAQQKEGRLASAEGLYEQALASLPNHFDALHMLGVVKLQLGKFEEATRLLVAGLPLAPEGAIANFKHNLALCLVGLARQRGVLETLTDDPAELKPPAPFVRAYAIPEAEATATGLISIILTDVSSLSGLRRSLDGIRARDRGNIEIIAAIAAHTPDHEALRAALDGCGTPARLIVAAAADTLAGQVNIAAAAATGAYLCFLRAGDHWSPQWLRQMTGALNACGAQWGYGGLRVVADDGTIARFGSSPGVDALLRAQDALYVHRTASLGFLSFNPVAAGRNLMARSDLWRRRGGLAAGAADPFLDWAWRTAWNEEPVYVDEPGYLIPPATERLHLHDAFARMIASTTTRVRADDGDPERADTKNPYLRHGLSVFWARQWRQLRALQASAMPVEVLLGCAAMLDMAPIEPATPIHARRAA
jgi:SEC-C motif/Tetratricopeptide repeat